MLGKSTLFEIVPIRSNGGVILWPEELITSRGSWVRDTETSSLLFGLVCFFGLFCSALRQKSEAGWYRGNKIV